jgi:hypothetical protein
MNNLIPDMTLGVFVIEPAVCRKFYAADNTDSAKPTDNKKSPAKVREDAPRNNEGRNGNRRDTGRASANNATRTLPEISQAQIDVLKSKGLIKWTGDARGRIPHPVNILEANGPAGLSKICMMFVVRDRYCRFGADCKLKHIAGLRDFTAANKAKFQAFVGNHNLMELANAGTTTNNN